MIKLLQKQICAGGFSSFFAVVFAISTHTYSEGREPNATKFGDGIGRLSARKVLF